jgi:hypothetical protein
MGASIRCFVQSASSSWYDLAVANGKQGNIELYNES